MEIISGFNIKNILTALFCVLFSFTVGVYADRWYILQNIASDIELNIQEDYRTIKNDEYTAKKIYCYNYIKDLVSCSLNK